jgi:hypothetical protein
MQMKGMVFTEFLEMVEVKFSPEMVDDIIDDSVLASGGAYTAVGTYDHQEMVQLVTALSQRSALPVTDLMHVFGEHLLGRFYAMHPDFFSEIRSSLDFLEGIETYIHTEVRKLYPDAQLPQFECVRSADGLQMVYRSPRHFGDLAEGLIRGAIAHFGDQVDMARHQQADGSVLFDLRLLN